MLSSAFIVSLLATTAAAVPSQRRATCSTKAPAFYLAGDSTTAIGGGWGDGFIAILQNGAKGTNQGHNGATTVSFKSGGDWAKVISNVKSATSSYDVYVTIQFGHNDQKAENNISLSQYETNLKAFAADVKSAGGTPILVTPLTRRSFSGTTLSDSLKDQRTYTIAAATSGGYSYIDLNQASKEYVQAIGNTAAAKYDLTSGDSTHLNTKGQAVFGRMVADLLLGHTPTIPTSATAGESSSNCFVKYFKTNTTLSTEIWSGVAA